MTEGVLSTAATAPTNSCVVQDRPMRHPLFECRRVMSQGLPASGRSASPVIKRAERCMVT